MAFAAGAYEGAPLRIARVSFTGDRSYELSVPAGRARSLRGADRRAAAARSAAGFSVSKG